ncbi:PREDICTED: uncharacterized protein LOC104603378 [Nelumbo nucifera]|uniref:Small ribosomal subunit protein uS15c n=1 Tax=Nelumbo nucifera TaxID=4432 RepID=A0A1U8ADV0_NELNU|nr:PREDICTED: uncharacterized protein LOC104603378 [Nelumbo nucifera]
MAAMALRLRSSCSRTIRNPSFVQFFSSSSPDSDDGDDKKDIQSSPSTPYFSDIKASLKQASPPRRFPQSPPKDIPPLATAKPSKIASLEEIRKNLSEFRRRSSPPPPDEKPSSSSSSETVSFQELYKRNVVEKSEGENAGARSAKGGKLSFEAIRESLRQLRSSTGNQNMNDRYRGQADRGSKVLDPMSLEAFKNSLKLQPQEPSSTPSVFGGSETLPVSVFGKEMREKDKEPQEMKTEFLKMYSYGELGEKLRMLRPANNKKDKNWFSLRELNERLMKLREFEEKEADSRIGGVSFKDLRDSLVRLRMSDDDKAKKSSMQRLDILGQLGKTPNFMMAPPKEHLVEKYFHPDNMSSAEKMKLELKRVRDEFKMSESDCGSARVQVAQLTTKIKHLASVLRKKDKHSRKGLEAMVRRRKKLLKYLRRTDWESYCLVLSKLGLRDNPDYKS